MRLRAAIVLSLVATGLGAGLVACFDLFHSTSGILDACQLDAEACASDASGDAPGPTDFCEWTSTTAYQNAGVACAWLEACEAPLEHNDLGDCMLRALLAYDCEANPDHPVSGGTKQLWDALWQAKTCADVDRVVFPKGVQACPQGPRPGCQSNSPTRVYCVDAGRPAAAENCELWAQTCDPSLGCVGCLGCFDSDGDAGDAGDADTCTPDASATCSNGTAVSCPSGLVESINCDELLQQTGGCNPGPLTPPADPTSPCFIDAGAQDAGDAGCVGGCSGNTLIGCARGVSYTTDCSLIDARCTPSVTTPDNKTHAACAFSP
ncbi:MAG TPA: hypothetical protein VMI75_22240 [Polyangiaceae bacterium]|nr:hypothetical protein [Polyangiaceae bacterium]